MDPTHARAFVKMVSDNHDGDAGDVFYKMVNDNENRSFAEELWLYAEGQDKYEQNSLFMIRLLCFFGEKKWTYKYLCQVALDVAKVDGRQLPDSIHARMILGEANEHTKEYGRLMEQWGTSQFSVKQEPVNEKP